MIKEKSELWSKTSLAIGKIFSYLPFSPNTYSWSTVPAAVIGFLFVCYDHLLLACLFFLIAGLLDVIDGGCARSRGVVSARGAFLDGCLDRVVDFIFVGSFFAAPVQLPCLSLGIWIYMAGFGVIMPTLIVAYANHRKAVKDDDEKVVWRILNRGEIYFLMLAILLAANWSPVIGGYLLMLLVILTAITVMQSFCLAMYHAGINESNKKSY